MAKVLIFFYPHPRTFFFIAFRERGREGEKHQLVGETLIGCFLYVPGLGISSPWIGDQTCSLGMCFDQESAQPLSSGMRVQPREPHWPGEQRYLIKNIIAIYFGTEDYFSIALILKAKKKDSE